MTTELTQFLWPNKIASCALFLRLQTLTVQSSEPETIYLSSLVIAIDLALFVWPSKNKP